MDQIAEILISALLVIAGVFGLVGSFGLLKLPDPMTRLHAPTKASTVGVGAVLIASMLYFWLLRGDLSWHELLIMLFLVPDRPDHREFYRQGASAPRKNRSRSAPHRHQPGMGHL